MSLVRSVPDATFENLGHDKDGKLFWLSSEYMVLLGYKDSKQFNRAVVARALSACIAAGMPALEHFEATRITRGSEVEEDYELTRFGCYLCAMSADQRKPEVARALVYFARIADWSKNNLIK